MARTTDSVVLQSWHAVVCIDDLSPESPRITQLAGQPIRIDQHDDHTIRAVETNADGTAGRLLQSQVQYHYVWVCLDVPSSALFAMPEYAESDRRIVPCGTVTVRASGLRIVENFLDLGHFPYVHPGVLGEEPHTEVAPYKAEIRDDVDEVWATDCTFFQQQAAMSASDGQVTRYEYRVPSPFVCILYKTCPEDPNRWDVITLFVQPRDEFLCDVHPFMCLVDSINTQNALIHFQQMIFVQDRNILENQRPPGLPLDPRDEVAVRADATSVAYRRWLRRKHLVYGTHRHDEPSDAHT